MTTRRKNKREIVKDVNYYTRLKWTYTIEEESMDGKKYYIIRVNELPGICTDAETLEEAMNNIREAMRSAFKLYLYMRRNEEIPEPINEKDFSGKIT